MSASNDDRQGASEARPWQKRGYVVSQQQAKSLNEEELKRLTKEELVWLARNEALPHRSKMNKAQLARTLRRHYQRKTK